MDYNRLQKIHDKMAARFNQGLVEVTSTTTVPGIEPWDPPQVITTTIPVNAVVKGVAEEFIDNVNIVASDLMVQIAAVEMPPAVSDIIKIDGRSLAVLAVKPIPASGPPVAIRLICRG